MRVLVTGADGFVGPWLARELTATGHEAVLANGPTASTSPLDLANPEAVAELVRHAAPAAIINLAGQSSVAASHSNPLAALQVNTLGVLNLLQAVRSHAPRCRVLLVGSGEMYGPQPGETRATESSPLRPTSPYASTKVCAEVLGAQFAQSYGMDVLFARPFNHLGRGQAPSFMVPSFAGQLAAVRRGEQPPRIQVGNLEPIRDFCHVADVVAAYRLLLERGATGAAYNVCSGTGRSIRSVLDRLVELAGVAVTVEVDPQRYRPSDAPRIVGDPGQLEALGWSRRFSIDDALRDVLAER
jgi:GDP-4-dehydro-6-deoxy-D-mannose reductase